MLDTATMANTTISIALVLGAFTLASCKTQSAGHNSPAPHPQALSAPVSDEAHRSLGDADVAQHDNPRLTALAKGQPSAPGADVAAEPPDGMVYIPGGRFLMGMPANVTQGAPPQQPHVRAFFLDQLEVSVEEYLACVKTSRCELPAHKPGCNGTAKKPKLTHPINCVTKQQAERYCSEQGKRLPTQAEWEYAARGADGRIYPWGNELPSEQLCWQGRKGAESELTCPVGSFPQGASPFGALDMAGNVAEWTSSENREAAGPGAFYVRGGGFQLDDLARADGPDTYDVRSDNPRSFGDDSVLQDVGVRCAKDL